MIIALIATDLPEPVVRADKQVRHFREVDDNRMAFDIFADSHFKRCAMGVFEHVAQ